MSTLGIVCIVFGSVALVGIGALVYAAIKASKRTMNQFEKMFDETLKKF